MSTPTISELLELFRGKRVLVTGGLGFIGSSLALRLAEAGAEVLLVDSMIDEYGGNLFNIAPAADRVRVNFCDIRDEPAVQYLVRDQDYVFHCASQVSHIKSLETPFPDIDINIRGTAVLLQALKDHCPSAKVVKLGSRGQYGSVTELPASEECLPDPKGVYEISLLSAEYLHRCYHRMHGVRSVMLRLTNIYGPRAQMKHNRFGVANWFIRLALDGKTIPLFGDGSIRRDFLYVDDCVEAILRAATSPDAEGEVLNVGRDDPSSFKELAETIVKVLGRGEWQCEPFSEERKAQEPGDYYSDISKIERCTGWTPRTTLEEGVRKTLAFYQENREHYW